MSQIGVSFGGVLKERDRFQEVVKHIEYTSQLGTTKSAMFEDIDNMISQIPPLVGDMQA